jgi:hypothetical protein
MFDWNLLKESFTKSLPNTILIILVFLSLNNKLNRLLIVEGIQEVKIKQLEENIKSVDKNKNKLIKLEASLSAHLGEAYIREEEDE